MTLLASLEFTANASFDKGDYPTATHIKVQVVAGGAGAGSGRRGATGSNRTGGSGGAAGQVNEEEFDIAALPSSVSITVGQGGVGGAAQISDNTNGNNGSDGGDSSFGNLLHAEGGGKGLGGTSGTNVLGGQPRTRPVSASHYPLYFQGAGQTILPGQGGRGVVAPESSNASGTRGSRGDFLGGPGGGAGGVGAGTTNVWASGAEGGAAHNTDGGGLLQRNIGSQADALGGGDGSDDASGFYFGDGASSVAGSAGTPGSAGNNGGFPGGGASGGSASDNGNASGAGGSGGDGAVRIWVYA